MILSCESLSCDGHFQNQIGKIGHFKKEHKKVGHFEKKARDQF